MTEKLDFEAEKSLLSSLLETSKLYRHSKEYLELLNFISRLRKFAPFNGFILHLQKPGLRFAASEYEWKKFFGRTLKDGARPLIILWPFSPVALVYDVEDTVGEPLPESVLHSFFAEGNFDPLKFLVLKRPITRKGIELKFVEYGEAIAGKIRQNSESEGLEIVSRSRDGKTKPRYIIRINSKHEPTVQFVSLIHELAHLFLGHLGPDKYLKIADRGSRHSYKQRELEAESVAYLVCARNDIHSVSEAYLYNFVDSNTTVDHIDLYAVLKAAGQIESLLDLGDTVNFGNEPNI